MSLADQIIHGTIDNVKRMIENGENVNELDAYGYTPLIETAIARKNDIAELLIKNGADVNGTDLTARTPLYWAVDNFNKDLAKLLLENGASANAYTIGSEPILVHPLLRQQNELKSLLYEHGADLNFAQDFINTKLLAHRFELHGFLEIVNADGKYIDIDLEGFFLEFTLGIIENSLRRFTNNFAARQLRNYFPLFDTISHALDNANNLLKYQHYIIDIKEFSDEIDKLLSIDPLIVPIGYSGHAITIIRSGNFLIKCDRGEVGRKYGSVVLYRMKNTEAFNSEFLKQLIYKRQPKCFIEKGMNDYLGLTQIDTLPIHTQITGNCSWANVEASIPALIFLQAMKSKLYHKQDDINKFKELSAFLYEKWSRWDQDTALSECIQSFYSANAARKATKASLLAAILFQTCDHFENPDLERSEKILNILTIPEYDYVLKSYIQTYYHRFKTQAGKNLIELLDMCGIKIDLHL